MMKKLLVAFYLLGGVCLWAQEKEPPINMEEYKKSMLGGLKKTRINFQIKGVVVDENGNSLDGVEMRFKTKKMVGFNKFLKKEVKKQLMAVSPLKQLDKTD